MASDLVIPIIVKDAKLRIVDNVTIIIKFVILAKKDMHLPIQVQKMNVGTAK